MRRLLSIMVLIPFVTLAAAQDQLPASVSGIVMNASTNAPFPGVLVIMAGGGHRLLEFFAFKPRRRNTMPKYLIEREIPGAGKLSERDLIAISKKSRRVLERLGPEIQWVHSYVTADHIFCVYIAPNEEMIREHAKQGEFPVTKISMIGTIIDPTTAEK